EVEISAYRRQIVISIVGLGDGEHTPDLRRVVFDYDAIDLRIHSGEVARVERGRGQDQQSTNQHLDELHLCPSGGKTAGGPTALPQSAIFIMRGVVARSLGAPVLRAGPRDAVIDG